MGQVESIGASHFSSSGRSSRHSRSTTPTPRGPSRSPRRASPAKRQSTSHRKQVASKKGTSRTTRASVVGGDGRNRVGSRRFTVSGSRSSGRQVLNHTSNSRRATGHNQQSRKSQQRLNESAIKHPQPVIRRQRRISAGTSSSIGTEASVPVITVTDHSEAETDIEFDPSQLQDKRGRTNRTSTPKVKTQGMDLSVSRHESSSVSAQGSSKKQGGAATASVAAKSGKSKSKKEKRSRSKSGNSSSVSVESTSSSQSKSSKKVSKAARKSSADLRLKRGLLSKTDPKAEAVNKWQDIVDEFEGSLEDQSSSSKQSKSKKEQRRVNKIANLEQYENVRQAFNKSMPLPMQMAPPGARVEDIEGETASETSSYSWNLMTPMQKASAAAGASQSQQMSSSRSQSMSMQEGRAAAASAQMQSGSAAASSRGQSASSQSQSKVQSRSSVSAAMGAASAGGAAGAMVASSKAQMAKRQSASHGGMAAAGAKRSVTAEHSVTEERHEVVQQTRGAAAAAKYGRREKGVKFRQTEVDKQAVYIVDDAVERALRFLYGDRRKSHASSSSSNSRLNSAQHSQQSQHSSSSIMKTSHIEKNIVEHIEHRRSSAKKMPQKQVRSPSMRPIPIGGRQAQGRSPSLRPLPLPGKQNTSAGGLYDLVIQPHGEEDDKSAMTRKFEERIPYDDAYSNATTNVHVYHNDHLPPPLPAYQEDDKKDKRKGVVDPPTITRGTVTRVFHELENQRDVPASSLLAQLRSMDGPPVEYSTNTWPLAKPVMSPNDTSATSFTESLPSYNPHYNTLPSEANLGSYTGQWHSLHSLQDYPSRQSTPSPTRIDLRMNTGELVRSLPLSLPPSYVYPRQEIDDIAQSISLPAIQEDDEYGAYSNEPMIVADLLDRQEPVYTVKGQQPAVNMHKNQVLNFYVFNQHKPEPGMPKITYAAQDIETNFGGERQQLMNVYVNEDEVRDMVSEGVQVYQPEDPILPDHKEYTIYHKQTQTPDIAKPKKSPSSPKKIERKKERIIKHILPRKPPERPASPAVHRETHHYITKERHVQSLPPAPPQTSEFCVQTDMTGQDWDDEVNAMNRALTTAEQRALDAEQTINEMHASNAAIDSVVREIEEVVRVQESQPPSLSRDIPITTRASPERTIMDIVERTYAPPPPRQPAPEPEPEPEPEDSDEEETYEWTEIEEKEQRLSMAIFEEIEFNLSRSQGGKTSSETGKTSELVPWVFPGKYEAVVDRRKQKVTQVKDIHREGGNVMVQSGSVPALANSRDGFVTSRGLESLSAEGKIGGAGILEERGVQSWSEHSKNTGGDAQKVNKSEIVTTVSDSSNLSSPTSGRYRTIYERQIMSPAPRETASATDKTRNRTTNEKTERYITVTREDKPADNKKFSSTHVLDVAGNRQMNGTEGGGRGVTTGKTITTYTRLKSPPKGSQHSTTYIRQSGPKDNISKKSEVHTTTYSRPVKEDHTVTSTNSSGYSSSDNTSQMRIDKLHSFELPDIDGAVKHHKHYKTEADIQLSGPVTSQESMTRKSDRSKRFVSRFDPGNIYFTVPQWTPVESSELFLNMSQDSDEASKREHDNDSLPDTLPGVEAEHIKRRSVATKSESQQLPPKVHSEIVQDEEGNLLKVTTTEQQMTKTVDYVPDAESPKRKQTTEEMGEESFVEVDLTTEHFESSKVESDEENEEGGDDIQGDIPEGNTILVAGPDVVEETSIGYKPIEYDDQEKSLGIADEEVAALERQYLYDMNTATLQPVKIKDGKSGEMLMQYTVGDTMVTEL